MKKLVCAVKSVFLVRIAKYSGVISVAPLYERRKTPVADRRYSISHHYILHSFVMVLLLAAAHSAFAVSVSSTEMAEASRWVAAKFEGQVQEAPPESYLVVLGGRGRLERNERDGSPLQIFKTTYHRGLYVDGLSKVTVHLASRGKSLQAVVGLDGHYDACGYTNARQVFEVMVAGQRKYQSPEIKVFTSGIPVNVDLGGAQEFVLEDGNPKEADWCGEAVWANARVTLENGHTLWLGDLPIAPLNRSFSTSPPFAFTYGGKPSAEFLRTWELHRSSQPLDAQRTEYDLTYTDRKTGLVVRCVGVAYHDFPTVEWTLYFKNAGTEDTPILQDIQALDTRFKRSSGGEFLLHHFQGSYATSTDYAPIKTILGPKAEITLASAGGRPTDGNLCYFNIQWPEHGVIVALGWPGQWAARFTREQGRGLEIRAGQELTHFVLHPGEEVRTPLVALQFYQGGWIRAQNIWRRWMLAHNVPRPGGKPLGPRVAAGTSLWTDEMTHATQQIEELFIDRYLEEKIKPDYWWMDAGWYVNNGSWVNTGTWQVDKKRFPNGLRAVSDYAHARGMKTIVWVEPERVTRGTWLWNEHPDWLLRTPEEEKHGQALLNLGNPAAVQWLVSYMSRLITQQGIDVYRTDFNIAPLEFWRDHDTPDREGITEIRYVEGFLQYLDELHRLHPNVLFDTCASGGRRNDLETLRRAVPLHRSDYTFEPVGVQNAGYGIAFWIPFYGTPTVAHDNYDFRSAWGPQINLAWDVRRTDTDYRHLRHMLAQWREVAKDFFGDYYPLTPYDPTNKAWMAWQFNRPSLGEGMVEAFRRVRSSCESMRLRLHGLEPGASYDVRSLDNPGVRQMTGRDLMDQGLQVTLTHQPDSAVLVYTLVKAQPVK